MHLQSTVHFAGETKQPGSKMSNIHCTGDPDRSAEVTVSLDVELLNVHSSIVCRVVVVFRCGGLPVAGNPGL